MKFIDTSNLLKILFEERHPRNVNNKNGEIKFSDFLKNLIENGENYNNLSLEKKVSHLLRGFPKEIRSQNYPKIFDTKDKKAKLTVDFIRNPHKEDISKQTHFIDKTLLNLPFPIFITLNGLKDISPLKVMLSKKINTNNIEVKTANLSKPLNTSTAKGNLPNLTRKSKIIVTKPLNNSEKAVNIGKIFIKNKKNKIRFLQVKTLNLGLQNKKILIKNFTVIKKTLPKGLKNLRPQRVLWENISNLVSLSQISKNGVNKKVENPVGKIRQKQASKKKIHKLLQFPNEEKLNKTYNANLSQNSVLENLTRNLHNKITTNVREISITKKLDRNKEDNNTFSSPNTNLNQLDFENLRKLKNLIGSNKVEKTEDFGKYHKHFSLKIPLDENTKLQIRFVKNNFYAKIVSNSETVNILVQNLPNLTQQLANLGFNKTVVQVQTAQNSSGKNSNRQNPQDGNNKHKNAEKVTLNSKDNNSSGFSFSFYL